MGAGVGVGVVVVEGPGGGGVVCEVARLYSGQGTQLALMEVSKLSLPSLASFASLDSITPLTTFATLPPLKLNISSRIVLALLIRSSSSG